MREKIKIKLLTGPKLKTITHRLKSYAKINLSQTLLKKEKQINYTNRDFCCFY